jgi:hypothetical protein
VQQRVRAADIDEGAVVGEAANLALHGIAFSQFGEAALFAGALFVFGNGAAIDDHIFVFHVELDDAAADFLLD